MKLDAKKIKKFSPLHFFDVKTQVHTFQIIFPFSLNGSNHLNFCYAIFSLLFYDDLLCYLNQRQRILRQRPWNQDCKFPSFHDVNLKYMSEFNSNSVLIIIMIKVIKFISRGIVVYDTSEDS